jgi:hypothetical protein
MDHDYIKNDNASMAGATYSYDNSCEDTAAPATDEWNNFYPDAAF